MDQNNLFRIRKDDEKEASVSRSGNGAGVGESIRPFRIEVSRENLEDLRERLARTRWPDGWALSAGTVGFPWTT